MIIVLLFTIILVAVFIIQEVQVDKIKTGDYILWYTYKEKREGINISEKIRRMF